MGCAHCAIRASTILVVCQPVWYGEGPQEEDEKALHGLTFALAWRQKSPFSSHDLPASSVRWASDKQSHERHGSQDNFYWPAHNAHTQAVTPTEILASLGLRVYLRSRRVLAHPFYASPVVLRIRRKNWRCSRSSSSKKPRASQSSWLLVRSRQCSRALVPAHGDAVQYAEIVTAAIVGDCANTIARGQHLLLRCEHSTGWLARHTPYVLLSVLHRHQDQAR